MSKSALKLLLNSMSKGDIIKMVLELYSARKEAKEYLDFYVEPDEKGKLEEYKRIIKEEFYPKKETREPKTRFSVCRKAISDFKKLKPSEELIAELMVFYMENACQFTYDYGDMWEQYYISVESNFEKTLLYIDKYNLWDKFESRIKMCLRWASPCGWGFPDSLYGMYYELRPPIWTRKNQQ